MSDDRSLLMILGNQLFPQRLRPDAHLGPRCKQVSQRKGQRQHPLANRLLWQDVVNDEYQLGPSPAIYDVKAGLARTEIERTKAMTHPTPATATATKSIMNAVMNSAAQKLSFSVNALYRTKAPITAIASMNIFLGNMEEMTALVCAE